jgi:hypothetical protein
MPRSRFGGGHKRGDSQLVGHELKVFNPCHRTFSHKINHQNFFAADAGNSPAASHCNGSRCHRLDLNLSELPSIEKIIFTAGIKNPRRY